MSTQLVAVRQLDNRQALGNCIYHELYSNAGENARVGKSSVRCEIKHFILNVISDSEQPSGVIGVSHVHRQSLRIALDESLKVIPWDYSKPLQTLTAGTIHLSLNPVSRNATPVFVSDSKIEEWCRNVLKDQVVTIGQSVFIETMDKTSLSSVTLYGAVTRIEGFDLGVSGIETSLLQGLITNQTEFLADTTSPVIQVQKSKSKQRNLFKADFNFEQLGIGGLDKEFADIFRRAFASRIYPPHVVQQLGIAHVRGMLLHGPPGTGKTLIARQIGKALHAKEPKVVNGPEVLNKFVGQSEENIRKLFGDAEADQKKYGDNSPLHIIIFDELDAICKQRGTNPSGAGVNDSVVNQLLSKIDGVDALNNILLIGMTNRMDMLDEALLRPGRLEVHIEIGLPDQLGRVQIFKIHTASMRESKRLADNVDLEELAKRTKNFSGAEITGLVRSAVSYSFARNVNFQKLEAPTDDTNVKVNKDDFEEALREVKPAFGVAEDSLNKYILNGIILFCPAMEKLRDDLKIAAKQVRESVTSPIVSLLLWGSPGSGKTAMACHIAQLSGFPLVKIISPNDYIGYTELAKSNAITRAFDDAYKSDLSIVILDDIERLIDFAPIGPRFSNILLQTLMVLIKRVPNKEGRRILIIGTSSAPEFINNSGLSATFQLAYLVPDIRNADSLARILEIRQQSPGDIDTHESNKLVRSIYDRGATTPSTTKIAIKQLFQALEMASEMSKPDKMNSKVVIGCLRDYGVQKI